ALQLPGMATILGMALLGAAVNPAIQPILALHLRDLHGWHPPWLDGIIYSLPGMALVFLAYTWTCAGERRGRAEVMIRGLVGVALGLVVLTLTGSIWLFGLGYLLVGIFLAAVGPNAAACVAREVPAEKRGRTYGILQAANTLGAFLAPLFAGAVTALLGLRGLFATMAAVVAGVAWMLLVRTKRLRAPGRIAAETAAASSGPADEYR
ncbi:MAG: MFS transporter, partial [Bacteroidota bacterium]